MFNQKSTELKKKIVDIILTQIIPINKRPDFFWGKKINNFLVAKLVIQIMSFKNTTHDTIEKQKKNTKKLKPHGSVYEKIFFSPSPGLGTNKLWK